MHFSPFLDKYLHIANLTTKTKTYNDGGGVAFYNDEDDDEEGGMAWSSKWPGSCRGCFVISQVIQVIHVYPLYHCIPMYTIVYPCNHYTCNTWITCRGSKKFAKKRQMFEIALDTCSSACSTYLPTKAKFSPGKGWCRLMSGGLEKFGLPPPPSTRFIPLFSDPSQIIDIWVIRRKLTTELGDWKFGRIVVAGGKHPECAHDSVRNFWAQSLHKMVGMLKIHIWYQYECF